MASILARRSAQIVCRRVAVTNTPRQIHGSALAQKDSWFGNIFKGTEKEATATGSTISQSEKQETSQNAQETVKVVTPTGSDAVVISTVTQNNTTTSSTEKKRSKPPKRKLSPEEKTKRYTDTMAFITPRLGRHPQVKLSLIKKTTWIRLLGVTQSEEELKAVFDKFPAWRDMGHQFDTDLSEAFVRRCIYLKKPQLAIEVFGNYAKYNIPLSLTGARELLNATYEKEPLSTVITITSLFDVYKLPPVAQDLSCCAMVVSACLKDKNPDAKVVADALLPQLKKLLHNTEPKSVPKSNERAQNMPILWAIWALGKVDRLLFEARGTREQWLRDWRLKSGHIAQADQF